MSQSESQKNETTTVSHRPLSLTNPTLVGPYRIEPPNEIKWVCECPSDSLGNKNWHREHEASCDDCKTMRPGFPKSAREFVETQMSLLLETPPLFGGHVCPHCDRPITVM